MTDHGRRLCAAALLLLSVVLVHAPGLTNGFVWDDDSYLTENPLIRSPDGLRAIWTRPTASPQYYPLVFTVFRAAHALWGFDPLGYHAVNILLHAASALLLWGILRRLSVGGAWAAALLFAIHPVQVESVAWVTELKNVLSGFFYLASFLACMGAFGLSREGEARQGSLGWGRYSAALLLFVCALLSKTVTATLPFAFLLAWWWRRGKPPARVVLGLVPFAALGAAAGSVTAWLEVNHVGAQGAAWVHTPVERGLIAGRALWFYAGKLLLPFDLLFVYPRWTVDATALGQYLFPLGALAVLAGLWFLRERFGKGPLAGGLFFVLTLGPALGFTNIYPARFSFVADHFQYLACIGLLSLAAAGGAKAWQHGAQRGWPVGAMGVPAALVAVALGALTVSRTGVYADEETLWRRTLEGNPGAAIACGRLVSLALGKGRQDEAERLIEYGLRRFPSAPEFPSFLGTLGRIRGNLPEARLRFEHALRLDPQFPPALNGLASVQEELGNTAQAVALYDRAAYADVRSWPSLYDEARLLGEKGDYAGAAEKLRLLLSEHPEHAPSRVLHGMALDRLGDAAGALRQLREAVRLHPGDPAAHNYLGVLLAEQEDFEGAERAWREALRLRPDHAESKANLGALEAGRRRR